jgi:hypothetical protein
MPFAGSNLYKGQALAVSQIFTAGSQNAQVALANLPAGAGQANVGDFCIRSDQNNRWYVMARRTAVASVFGDWDLIAPMNSALIAVDPAVLGQVTVQSVMTTIAGRWVPPPNVRNVRILGPYDISWASPLAADTRDGQPLADVRILASDVLFAVCPSLPAGMVIDSCYVTGAGTGSVVAMNVTAAPINPPIDLQVFVIAFGTA